MAAVSGSTTAIESLGVSSRQLHLRARVAGADFTGLAKALHGLQRTLEHLHAEVRDPDSLVNQPSASISHASDGHVYARPLAALVQDSEFVLRQASAVLEVHSNALGGSEECDEDKVERCSKIDAVRSDVASQKARIDVFLDTVQLHNSTRTQGALERAEHSRFDRDSILDKIDAVATRLFRARRGSPADNTHEDLWQEFQAELEREGFSREVLQRNKEVLRAYVRELESHESLDDGGPPSVRGLLEGPSRSPMGGALVLSAPNGEAGPNDVPISNEGRRRMPAAEASNSLQPYRSFGSAEIARGSSRSGYEPCSDSDSSDSESSSSSPTSASLTIPHEVISTSDLLLFLNRSNTATMAGRQSRYLSPGAPPSYSLSTGTTPVHRYLPSGANQLQIPSTAYNDQRPGSPRGRRSESPPRYSQLPPAYHGAASPTSSSMTPPPPYESHVHSAHPSSAPPSGSGPQRRQYSSLAPDGKGQGIPLDAKWTKINRDLVALEVLERAGVRYEARPDFVAVLGILSREEIAELARQSAQVRNARRGPPPTPPTPRRPETPRMRGRPRRAAEPSSAWAAGQDSSDDERDHKKTRQPFDRSRYVPRDYQDRTNPKNSYAFIVSPPDHGEHLSPSSTVGPKPILKNKNPNHVRFDGDGPREISPGYYSERPHREGKPGPARDRDRERERDRDTRDRERGQDHDRNRRRAEEDQRARERDRDRTRDRDRPDRPRSRDRDGGRLKAPTRGTHRHHDRERDRDRERERERDRSRDDRSSRRLKETVGAIGVGGAAATLLSVLTEAVTYL